LLRQKNKNQRLFLEDKKMKTTKILIILLVLTALLVCLERQTMAAPMGTAFTYQGHLYDANSVANDSYDFQFKIFDSQTNGSKLSADVNLPNVDVIDGQFNVEIDFGGGVFDGSAAWLEIGVRAGELEDPNVYTTLSPRQKVTPTPYALYATRAAGCDGDWAVPGNLNVAGHINSSENYKLNGKTVLSSDPAENLFVGEYVGQNCILEPPFPFAFFNTAVGYKAFYYNTTGNSNTAIGRWALYGNTTATGNTAVGREALSCNNGEENTAVGREALSRNTTGGGNSALGSGALYFNDTANANSAFGWWALHDNVSGAGNSAFGFQALRANPTGNENVAIGSTSLWFSDGSYNTAVGSGAGAWNMGSNNVFLGCGAGSSDTGSNNVSLGFGSACGSGSNNVSLGYNARGGSGINNVSLGTEAGNGGAGSGNIFLGYRSGFNETGSNKL
jgi:hypothetical protein